MIRRSIFTLREYLNMNSVGDVKEKIFGRVYLMFDTLEDSVRQYLKNVKNRVTHMKKESNWEQTSPVISLALYAYKIFRLPLVLLYYIYVLPFVFIGKKLFIYAILTVKIFSKKSSHARLILEHVLALLMLCKSVLDKVLSSKLTDLIAFCITTIFEIISAAFWPSSPSHSEKEISMVLSVQELVELLAYEEVECDGDESAEGLSVHFPRNVRMHNFIPLNPFKATIRIHRSVPMSHLQSSRSRNESNTDLVCASSDVQINVGGLLGQDSPASFPPTPFSRAKVMNKSSEKVISVLFAARDRLRLEAQSVSRDEYSRMLAREAQNSGQFAVFDPKQTSSGIALTCGNHSAIKVGKGLCCCSRAMMPIPVNNYVYFEFSITVSNAQVPSLGLGIAPQDCPLNVMVGSWPQSKGLYTDGQVLIGSHWFSSTNGKKVNAGSTVGILVYIPSGKTVGHGEAQAQTPTLLHSFINSFSARSDNSEEYSLGYDLGAHSDSNYDNTVLNQVACSAASSNSDECYESGVNAEKEKLLVQFNVDGEPIRHPREADSCLRNVMSLNVPLYPTVSLFSEETRVWCRFCEADVAFRTRSRIGAPPGVRVYCLDGSLLLEEKD